MTPNFFDVLGVARGARPRSSTTRPRRRSQPRWSSAIVCGATASPARADIIGRSLLVNGVPRTVVGVLAPGFVFRTAHFEQPDPSDVWIPMRPRPEPSRQLVPAARRPHARRRHAGAGRSRPARGSRPVEIAKYPHGRDLTASVVALEDDVSRDVRRILAIFAGGVALLLLVAVHQCRGAVPRSARSAAIASWRCGWRSAPAAAGSSASWSPRASLLAASPGCGRRRWRSG